MAYPHPFHRIVIEGSVYSERWATSFSMFGSALGPSSLELLELVQANVKSWFINTSTIGSTFISSVKLESVKVNRIGTDGKYMDPESFTYFYSPIVSGTSSAHSAPQLASVVTLRTGYDRGRASRGRMYLPPSVGFTVAGTDGRATTDAAKASADGIVTLFNSVSASYQTHFGPGDGTGHPVIMSAIGAGAWHSVTDVEAGRVIDTMRSRRSSLDENYQHSTVVPTWS